MDAEEPTTGHPSDEVFALLGAFLEDHPDPDDEDLERLVQAHPEKEVALRQAYASLRVGVELLGEDTPFDRTPESVGVVVDRFRLIRHLGKGGQGTVWEAEDTSMASRRVALKLFPASESSRAAVRRHEREADAGGRVSHPGIAHVYGAGESDGRAWIAMELVEDALTVRNHLEDLATQGTPEADQHREAARLVAQVAEAMQVAHERNVIHRDLKPQNILIGRGDRQVKITDFGLARLVDETAVSQTGVVIGTYSYMSPEQVDIGQSEIDHRTDVFSLGVVFYELLTLRRPFTGRDANEVARAILTQAPPDPRSIRPSIPRDLSVIALRALEKSRHRRFQSMSALAEDLRRWLASRAIRTRPLSFWRKIGTYLSRRRNLTIGFMIGAATTIATGAIIRRDPKDSGFPRPVFEERGWSLMSTLRTHWTRCLAIHPRDGLVYYYLEGTNGIRRFDPESGVTGDLVVTASKARAMIADAASGDLYFSELHDPGVVYRVPFDGNLACIGKPVTDPDCSSGMAIDTDYDGIVDRAHREPWVSGFAGEGDDDPYGLAIVPDNFEGGFLEPGDGLVVDGGYGEPTNAIWKWSVTRAEKETLLSRMPRGPREVVVTSTAVFLTDTVSPTEHAILQLLPDGGVQPVPTSVPIDPLAMTQDPRTGELVVFSTGFLLRVDPVSGAVKPILSGIGAVGTGGLGFSPDGRLMAVASGTSSGDGYIYVLQR